jgi:SAM-dependent methyltransferase
MSERKQHWEKIYQTRAPDEVSWFQSRPGVSLSLIQHAELDPNAPIIDLGGGCSLLVDHLLELGYRNLSVLDISGAALEISRRRLGELGDTVRWIESDATDFELDVRFSLWHDRAVFHFLTDPNDRAAYHANLERHLEPGGQVIISTFAPEGPQKCSGLDIIQYSEAQMVQELGQGFTLLESTTDAHTTPGGATQAFNCFRFRKN